MIEKNRLPKLPLSSTKIALSVVALITVFAVMSCEDIFLAALGIRKLNIKWNSEAGSVLLDGSPLSQSEWCVGHARRKIGTPISLECKPDSSHGWSFVKWSFIIEMLEGISSEIDDNPATFVPDYASYDVVLTRFNVAFPRIQAHRAYFLSNVDGSKARLFEYDPSSNACGPAAIVSTSSSLDGIRAGSDGIRLYFSNGESLLRYDGQTGSIAEVEKLDSWCDWAVSPDGSRLAKFDYDGFEVETPPGGPATELPLPQWSSQPSFSPDGNCLYYYEEAYSTDPSSAKAVKHNKLHSYDLRSDSDKQVLDTVEDYYLEDFEFSPDGTRVLLLFNTVYCQDGGHRLELHTIGSSGYRTVDWNATSFKWIDDRHIVFSSSKRTDQYGGDIRPSSGIYEFDVVTGGKTALVSLDGRCIGDFDLDPDVGSLLYLTYNGTTDSICDIYYMDSPNAPASNLTPYSFLSQATAN